MMASRLDPRAHLLDKYRRILLAPLAVALLTACRAGLPPEPPGSDPADADAATPNYRVQANPYETSAFAGEPAPMPGGHAGHGHMGHGSALPAGDAHTGHGAPAEKPSAESEAMPPNMHKQPDPR